MVRLEGASRVASICVCIMMFLDLFAVNLAIKKLFCALLSCERCEGLGVEL